MEGSAPYEAVNVVMHCGQTTMTGSPVVLG